jgi:hypothetical protein
MGAAWCAGAAVHPHNGPRPSRPSPHRHHRRRHHSWTLVADACRSVPCQAQQPQLPAPKPFRTRSKPCGAASAAASAPLAVAAPVQEATAAFHAATGAWWAAPCLASAMAKLLRQARLKAAAVASPWPWAVDNQWQCVPNSALASFDRVVYLASGALVAAPPVEGSPVSVSKSLPGGPALGLQLTLFAPCLAFVPQHWALTNDPTKTHTVHLCARVHEA